MKASIFDSKIDVGGSPVYASNMATNLTLLDERRVPPAWHGTKQFTRGGLHGIRRFGLARSTGVGKNCTRRRGCAQSV